MNSPININLFGIEAYNIKRIPDPDETERQHTGKSS
jgi:hypothetical protein